MARLREAGLDDADLAWIYASVGLDLGGHTSADIALGILAEIVAQRHAAAEAGSRPGTPASP